MQLKACIVGLGGVLAMAGASAACAQTWAPNAFDASPDVEARLTERLGDAGRKIWDMRSR